MADINIGGQVNAVHNSVNQTSVNNRPNIKSDNVSEVYKEDVKADAARREEEKEKLREELLDNVIAVSEDGDTVQVSDESSTKLQTELFDTDDDALYEDNSYIDNSARLTATVQRQEFSVPVDNDAARPELNTAIDTDVSPEPDVAVTADIDIADDNSSANITSYAGYTDTQLEQMYIKGDISKYDYDQEMEAREAQREETQNTNQNLNEQMMNTVNGIERVSQDAQQLQKAFGSNSAETPDPMSRIEIMSTLQDLTK